jgi:hypothetical protein
MGFHPITGWFGINNVIGWVGFNFPLVFLKLGPGIGAWYRLLPKVTSKPGPEFQTAPRFDMCNL